MNNEVNELDDFKQEAEDLLADAEKNLLTINTENFIQNYNTIFRTFHSLKGGAGMLGIIPLQNHMHKIENSFQETKARQNLTKEEINFYLKAIDRAREFLGTKEVSVDTQSPSIEKKVSEDLFKNAEISEKPIIYIIDDDKDILEILIDALIDESYELKTFINPLEAISQMEKTPPHLILTDVNMPQANGIDVLKKAYEINPNMPVVFISGALNTELLVNAIEFNISNVLEKPIDTEKVKKVVNELIDKHEIVNLLNKSMDIILFQFKDLYEYLIQKDKKGTANILKQDVQKLIKSQKLILKKISLVKN